MYQILGSAQRTGYEGVTVGRREYVKVVGKRLVEGSAFTVVLICLWTFCRVRSFDALCCGISLGVKMCLLSNPCSSSLSSFA